MTAQSKRNGCFKNNSMDDLFPCMETPFDDLTSYVFVILSMSVQAVVTKNVSLLVGLLHHVLLQGKQVKTDESVNGSAFLSGKLQRQTLVVSWL